MSCPLDDLLRYEANELDEKERCKLEAHIAECKYCRETLNTLRTVSDSGYGELPPPSLRRRRLRKSATFTARLFKRIVRIWRPLDDVNS